MSTPVWIAMALAAVLPVLMLRAPSYIHPDELFQSQEVVLAAMQGRYANVPWEFADATQPSRSIVPPLVTVSLPLRAASWLLVRVPLAASYLPLSELWVARLGPVLLLLGALYMCRQLARWYRLPSELTSALLATSWVFSVMLGRPFSNSLEAFALLLLTFLYASVRQLLHLPQSRFAGIKWATLGCAIGASAAFGMFVRFTFGAFALPTVLLAVGELCHAVGCAARPHTGQSGSKPRASAVGFSAFSVFCTAAALAAVGVAASVVAVDSVFFGGFSSFEELSAAARQCAGSAAAALLQRAHLAGGSLASACARLSFGLRVAPFNNALYNMDPANLALHGLHPRWQHLAVNGHIMFGPLWGVALAAVLAWALAAASRRLVRLLGRGGAAAARSRGPATTAAAVGPPAAASSWHGSPGELLTWSAATLIVPLAAISTAPHQEPRFLAPLVWPLAFIGAYVLRGEGKQSPAPSLVPSTAATLWPQRALPRPARVAFWAAWLLFNGVVGRLFGVLHQAHLPASVAVLGAAARSAVGTEAATPPSGVSSSPVAPLLSLDSAYGPLYRSLRSVLEAELHSHAASPTGDGAKELLSQPLRVVASYLGSYMVPHSALGLPSLRLMEAATQQTADSSGARNDSPWWAHPAPWASSRAGASAATQAAAIRMGGACVLPSDVERSRASQAAWLGAEACRLVVHLREYGGPEDASWQSDVLTNSALQRDASSAVQLVLFPSPLEAAVRRTLATLAPQPGCSCSLRMLGRLGPSLSTENPPASAAGWVAALLPQRVAEAWPVSSALETLERLTGACGVAGHAPAAAAAAPSAVYHRCAPALVAALVSCSCPK
jgi:phosphatidylinositol glycan class Z